jgi:O-antigen ligase
MTNDQIIYTVAIGSGVIGLIAYVAFILVPAWGAYSRLWERVAASFLTLYVLAGFIILGAAGGAAVVWFWDRIGA